MTDLATQGAKDARSHYELRREQATQNLAGLHQRHVRLVWLRTIFFAIAAVLLVIGYFGDTAPAITIPIGWLSAAAFFVAIVRHEHLRLETIRQRSDQRLFQQLIDRLDRNWSGVPDQSLIEDFSELDYADDLDIAGHASLLSLLTLAGTFPGRRCLQQWVAHPPSWTEIEQRQNAVRLLTPLREFRINILRTIRASGAESSEIYGLPAWGKTTAWLPQHKGAHLLSYLGPALVIGGAIAFAALIGQENTQLVNAAAIVVGVGFLLNIVVTIFWGSWVHDIFQKVTGEHRAVFQYASVFSSLNDLPEDSGMLSRIRQKATRDEDCAQIGFARLTSVVRLANFQRDPTLYVVYLALQLTILWDFRILKSLEKWKSKFGNSIEEWFDVLGEAEALISGATLADEYPNWCFPTNCDSDNRWVDAKQMGHPLLSDDARVCNDVEVGKTQPLLLVTGSNMAGKSTFMRALGLNLLLARTGSPVCAQQMEAASFELATSIRVRDSLKDGVSFFMAELNRLKQVVDLAHEHRKDNPQGLPPVLFLLDEILQGTNSQERQIAVASVLDRLLHSGAIGLVTTHDLDLAGAEEIRDVSQVVHFREYFETSDSEEVMRFDYQMRPGPTPTTNALKLLRMVGLEARKG